MENYNQKKKDQLGVDFGTACGRLKKSIMLMLVQECGRDSCFKCGKIIENVDDLTIEHKTPWLDVDSDLFWDLSNISFSHSFCNRPDRVYQKPLMVHGTRSTYENQLCRCEECKAWKKEKNKRTRLRSLSRQADRNAGSNPAANT